MRFGLSYLRYTIRSIALELYFEYINFYEKPEYNNLITTNPKTD